MNRQGADRGEQYRSVIFYHDREQEISARNLERSGKYKHAIVTQIKPASEYYLADESHQQYYQKPCQEKEMGLD